MSQKLTKTASIINGSPHSDLRMSPSDESVDGARMTVACHVAIIWCVWIYNSIQDETVGIQWISRYHWRQPGRWRSIICRRWLAVQVGWLSLRWLNTLRPRKNDRHFADDIFKCLFFNENVWISIKISLKFVPMVQLTIFQHWFK